MAVTAQAVLTAASTGDVQSLRNFYSNESSFVNARDDNGCTALHLAARSGSLDAVQFLLNVKADLSAANSRGQHPLHYACQKGSLDIVKALLDAGVEVDIKTRLGCTSLYFAAAAGYVEIVRLLIQRGADVNVLTENKSTPLMAATFKNHLPVVALLLEKAAKVDIQNSEGMTALHIAAKRGHLALLEALESYSEGASAIVDEQGRRYEDILAENAPRRSAAPVVPMYNTKTLTQHDSAFISQPGGAGVHNRVGLSNENASSDAVAEINNGSGLGSKAISVYPSAMQSAKYGVNGVKNGNGNPVDRSPTSSTASC